eukprot:9073881-Alexandrium_andersonii.AAC.1
MDCCHATSSASLESRGASAEIGRRLKNNITRTTAPDAALRSLMHLSAASCVPLRGAHGAGGACWG